MNSSCGKADIGLTREKTGSWTGNGTASGSLSGHTDWSDKTTLVTTAALYDSTLTTTTKTDTGRHYEYNMSTSRKLRNNTWGAYEGSGTGKGSGWDYLTVTKDGGYSREILVIAGLSSEADYIMPNSLTYTVTGKIEGSLSDKLDYKYDDTFSLSSGGWATATIGDGTRKITDVYTATEKGSMTQWGSDSHHRISHWDPYLGDLTYTVSVGLDMQNKRQTKTEIVFDWTNDGSSVTEQTKTSNRFYSKNEGSLDAQLLSVSGNVGSGNGTAEASNYHEAYRHDTKTARTVDASRTMTSGKNGSAFYESYKSTDESNSKSSFEQTGQWSIHSRVNQTVDGTYVTAKSDGTGESEDRWKTQTFEKSVTTWQWSYDGQTYGNKVSTLVESTETTSTTSSRTDYDSLFETKAWNASGIISQNSSAYAVHELSATDYSQLTETTSTNTGFEPQFLTGSVQAVMTITAVTGWNPSTANKFSFNTPELTVSGATSNAGLVLPDLVMTTTDFGAYGTVADTRSDWQKLKDTLVQAGDTFINDALQTAVWISGKLDSALDSFKDGATFVYEVSFLGWNGFIKWFAGSAGDGFDQFLNGLGWVAAIGQIPGTIICEPLDWIATGIEVAKDPSEPLNYVGLIPLVPSATGKVLKQAMKHADEVAEIAEGAAKLAKNGENAADAGQEIAEQGMKTLDEAAAALVSGLENATRLSSAELATGQRLEGILGKALKESPHLGADYVDDLGRSYDALGGFDPKFWNEKSFLHQIDKHLLKSNDFTVIDLTGFSQAQIDAVRGHLSTISPDQLERIIQIGF